MTLGQRVRSTEAREGRIDMIGVLSTVAVAVVHVTWDDGSTTWLRGSAIYNIELL